jgi:hypothetical protein
LALEVEVVDEIPPTNLNPPLTDPDAPILVQVRELFSEPFSMFNEPYIMLGPSVSSVLSHEVVRGRMCLL